MPKVKFHSFLYSKVWLLIVLVILIAGVYLNRSYAHIFEYDKVRNIVSMNIERNYILKDGAGTKTMKYVVLGDSLSYGFGARDYKGTFPYVVAKGMLKEYKEVQVVNLGVSGAVIGELIQFQLPKALEEKPGFVTVMIGTNDIHDFADKQEFTRSLEYIIDQLQSKTDAQILVINIPYLGTRGLILPPHDTILDSRIQDFNQAIKGVSDAKQVAFFDLYSASQKPFLDNPERYYSLDEFHPSDEGYILWGKLINGD